jgi:hypothetical protein
LVGIIESLVALLFLDYGLHGQLVILVDVLLNVVVVVVVVVVLLLLARTIGIGPPSLGSVLARARRLILLVRVERLRGVYG